jgi:UDP-galactopyranose mutase
VDIAAKPAAFADALGRALDRPRTEWLRAVDRRLAEISWARTWHGMSSKITDARRAGAASGARTVGDARSGTTQENAQHV